MIWTIDPLTIQRVFWYTVLIWTLVGWVTDVTRGIDGKRLEDPPNPPQERMEIMRCPICGRRHIEWWVDEDNGATHFYCEDCGYQWHEE